ncbi:MAG TPA: hypothetical protein VEZ16_11065 [Microvirga sp.]|nr:hypothetical protein [Microvirga sp.]
MKCQFCQQDLDDPCHNAQEMQQRAASHVERCEKALRSQQGTGAGSHPSDVQGRR